eukprot:2150193-Amphidinium_carterae.1
MNVNGAICAGHSGRPIRAFAEALAKRYKSPLAQEVSSKHDELSPSQPHLCNLCTGKNQHKNND